VGKEQRLTAARQGGGGQTLSVSEGKIKDSPSLQGIISPWRKRGGRERRRERRVCVYERINALRKGVGLHAALTERRGSEAQAYQEKSLVLSGKKKRAESVPDGDQPKRNSKGTFRWGKRTTSSPGTGTCAGRRRESVASLSGEKKGKYAGSTRRKEPLRTQGGSPWRVGIRTSLQVSTPSGAGVFTRSGCRGEGVSNRSVSVGGGRLCRGKASCL